MPRFCSFFITAALFLAAAHTAHAEPHRRDPKTALALSIAGTIAGPVLIYAGDKAHSTPTEIVGGATVLLGPSVGEWYSDRGATWGLAARGAGMVMLAVGVGQSICFEDAGCPGHDPQLGKALLGLGAAALVGGTLYDILDAPDAANQFNDEHHLSITPTIEHGGGGVALAGTF